MDKNALATKYVFEFQDGDTCEMSLSFIQLKRMAGKHKNIYARYSKIMAKGGEDEFDTLTVLYAAYVCANQDSDALMTEDEFIEKCGTDRYALQEAFSAMTNPKKRKASAEPSN